MAAGARAGVARAGVPDRPGGAVFISDLQRVRLLNAALAVVGEQGYKPMTVRRVSARAGVSSKTFYDLFSDREDCFLAAFDHAVDQLATIVAPAVAREREWAAGIRAGLGALLALLDQERELRRLVFVEALGAGPRVLARRAQVLGELGGVIDAGRAGAKDGLKPPPLTAEGLVGAAFGVIYGRLLENPDASLVPLQNALMSTIVLPYRGHRAAGSRAGSARGVKAGVGEARRAGAVGSGGAFRLTVRTHMVLTAVAELSSPGFKPSNREIADAAEIVDQGQISRLLARLERLELLRNTGVEAHAANAWELTPRGREIVSLSDHGPANLNLTKHTCVAPSASTSSKRRDD
jgi:AcrR family transcriptional regulator